MIDDDPVDDVFLAALELDLAAGECLADGWRLWGAMARSW
jgi:hypothetical protein